jgi:endonuclease YncB( thermonuclease family)
LDEIEDGQTVASETQDGRFVLKPVNDSSDRLYTYGARVVRVVGGDTLLVKIDLGFHMQSTQRLRLRGINTPELSTQAGVQAKAFVTEQLGLSPSLSWRPVARTMRAGMSRMCGIWRGVMMARGFWWMGCI